MIRTRTKLKISRRKRGRNANSYEKMMKTLLLQNQQIIIQQQNMMFMVMKQFQHIEPDLANQSQPRSDSTSNQLHQLIHQQTANPAATPSSPPTSATASSSVKMTPSSITTQASQLNHGSTLESVLSQMNQQSQPEHGSGSRQQHQTQSQQQQHSQQIHEAVSLQQHQQQQQSHQVFSQSAASMITLDEHHQQQHMQQVDSQLQESLINYLTPAASEQDPITDKSEDDDLVALLEGDGLLQNNLLYNPQTDIGSITPYKSSQQTPHEPSSYYSSGCESLTTPRVEHPRQPTTANISQTVVKNLADSFKSPTKPKINVQILSGSATGTMKNSKAKIIQRMNISEFLRHVHPEDAPKPSSQ